MANDTTNQKAMKVERDTFGSKLGIIAAAAGSAIGLGNIWKFPYITGEYGGAAFLVVYLICIAIIGLPVMLSELIIGRKGQRNPVGSFMKLAPGTVWTLAGWMGVAAAFIILSFYGGIAGWTLEYVIKALSGAFIGLTPEQIGGEFTGFISSNTRPILWQIVFMILTGYIVAAGVKDGIEKYSKILMPLLLVIILILDIRAVTLPGASAGLEFLFKPNWSALSAEGVLVALGHAFFSLSLGMGIILTYGSYIGKNENLTSTAIQVTIADTVVALLAGIAIFPAVFAFGIEPGAGPGLVFITLPNIFNQIPGGWFFSVLFFLLISVAALTSTISILEVVVAYFIEELKMARKKATWIAVLTITIVGIPASLSNGLLADVTLFGKNYFDILDWTSANILLPIAGILITVFIGWVWGTDRTREELSCNESLAVPYISLFMFLCKFIAPVAIAIVFLNGIGFIKL